MSLSRLWAKYVYDPPMGYLSRPVSDQIIRRVRHNYAAVLMAGGRLPEFGRMWVEVADHRPGDIRTSETIRWRVVTENGFTNVESRWPPRLVANAAALHFRPAPNDRCLVEMSP